MQFKQFFIEKIESIVGINNSAKILEFGCGQARNLVPLLKKYPNLAYTGIEPNSNEAKIAKDVLNEFQNVKISNEFANEINLNENSYDVCFSLSVLEHVKRLDEFLSNSIKAVKPGGNIIHLYDLGHALYPKTIKEKIHVWLGNVLPFILPAKKFVRYVDLDEVCAIMKKHGTDIVGVTYHQMPNHKEFIKLVDDNEDKNALIREILEWEFKVSERTQDVLREKKEKLFPTVCIWARKK